MTTVQRFTLDNGVRVLVEPNDHVMSAAVGLWCRTGSRHEQPEEAGITHVIEHMLFKGTTSRTAMQIAEEIEGRGGVLNAFTDKEQTCYFARVLADDIENAVDVLSDMLVHSLIDPTELDREKGVILEEIKRSEDEPGDYVHELHIQNRWASHPLGKPVIGTSQSVSSFGREALTSYMDRRYRAENVVVAIAGHVEPDEFVTYARNRLGGIASGMEETPIPRPEGASSKTEVPKDVEQVHFCIGSDSCSVYDVDIYALAVLDGVLGGGMSSRLFQEIREKRGLAYSIGSYNLSYTAGGAFTVYGGTSPSTWEEVQELVREELDKVIRDGVPSDELEKVKRNICGNMMLALEGMSSRMMRMSKNEIIHSREITAEETLANVDMVTADQVAALAGRLFPEQLVSTTAIGPF